MSALLHAGGLTRLDKLGQNRLSIVTFHRVLPDSLRDEYPMPGLAVTPEELEWFLRLFKEHFELLPLCDAIKRFEALPDRGGDTLPPMAITFDDGQRDNFLHAKPVLDRAGVHASFFVTTDAIECNGTLWHDEVGYGLRKAREADPAERARLLEGIGVSPDLSDAASANAACQRAKSLPIKEREAFLRKLRDVVPESGRPAWDGMMTWTELAELVAAGHEIGGHSASHALLPQCDDEQLHREIKSCRDVIRHRLNVPCATFCYPNGDHDARTVAEVREAEYLAAVTTRWGFNRSLKDPYRLARFDIQARNMLNRNGMLSKNLLAWRMSGLYRERVMRVAYLVSQYPAPSHTFIRREVWALREHGVDIETFSIRRPSRDQVLSEEDRQAHSETFYVLPANPLRLIGSHCRALAGNPAAYLKTLCFALRHRVAGLHALIWCVFYFAEAIVLAQELRRRNIDHVHNHFANGAADIGLFASRFLALTWSVSIHGTSDLSHPAITLLPEKVAHAKMVAFVSWFGRAQAMRVCDPAHWHKFVVVRCGLELEKLPDDVDVRPNQGLRLLCVARLSPEKGHIGLVQAVNALCEEGRDLTLTLIGEGPSRVHVEREIGELNMKSRVQLLGHQSETAVRNEMARSDVLVLASFMEGLPVVLIEAMALGVAVVAPAVAGIPELIEHRTHGLLYTPGRWDELKACLRELLDDPQLRAQCGDAGQVRARDEYDARVAVQPLLSYYSEK